jgi:hypothetical protein
MGRCLAEEADATINALMISPKKGHNGADCRHRAGNRAPEEEPDGGVIHSNATSTQVVAHEHLRRFGPLDMGLAAKLGVRRNHK